MENLFTLLFIPVLPHTINVVAIGVYTIIAMLIITAIIERKRG